MSKHGMKGLAILAAMALAAGGLLAAASEEALGTSSGSALPAPPAPAPATSLLDLEVTVDSGGAPSVELSGDGRLAFETQVLENPSRLVLDLPGTVSRLQEHQFAVGQGGVIRVRAGQYRAVPEPTARVVFDLEREVAYRVEEVPRGLTVRFGGEAIAEAQAAAQPEPAAAEVAAVRPEEPTAAAPAAEPLPPAEAPAPRESPEETPRAIAPESLDLLLQAAPALASAQADEPAPAAARPVASPSFETQTITTDTTQYTGKLISLNLVEADVKQVFRLFHEISGLNFVLDPSVEGRVTIVLDNVPWDQALDIILKNNGFDKILENNVIRIAATQKLAAEAASRKQLKEAKELEVEPITVTRTLSYAKAKDVERVIRDGGILSPRGKVIVDERTNTLIVSDIPKKVDPLDKLISTLDSETPQVMIEARIVETSRSFSRDLGVQWGFNAVADASKGTATNLSFPHNASVKYGLNLGSTETGDISPTNALAFKFGNILDSFTLDVALDALETEGQGRILSSPKIATQNNERAEIEQGIRIPVVNTTATEINVEFVSASLRLGVTPQITAEGTIILDVQVENNTPDFVNRVGDVPPINTQRAQTKVLISDGGTTVIGGIFTVNEGKSEVGVPWFRKLPVLGWLFKQRNITNENRELLIFITPKIMKVS